MTVLNMDELEKVNKVVAAIVNGKGQRTMSVQEIKAAFGLTDAEYEMCMELAMPQIRWKNEAYYYKVRFNQLLRGISLAVENVQKNRKNPIKDEQYVTNE